MVWHGGLARLDEHHSDLRAIWSTAETKYPYLSVMAPFKYDYLYSFYDRFFGQFRPIDNLLELGIYKGGSLVLWREALGCSIVGIDLDPPSETTPLIDRYCAEASSPGGIRYFWKTSQEDEIRLRAIVSDCFNGSIDVVIDDASHLYGPTRRSFEVLFPLVRPGGAYIIEDWPAGLRPDFQSGQGPLDRIVLDSIFWLRDRVWPIDSITVNPGCVLVIKSHGGWDPARAALNIPPTVESYESLQHQIYQQNLRINSLSASLNEVTEWAQRSALDVVDRDVLVNNLQLMANELGAGRSGAAAYSVPSDSFARQLQGKLASLRRRRDRTGWSEFTQFLKRYPVSRARAVLSRFRPK